ncbi:MAG: DUF2508 family protein [Thermosediminibacteraceae bacterium]|nr:DUF2508 family protein [Thermosediminibacteraceae bacterium]
MKKDFNSPTESVRLFLKEIEDARREMQFAEKAFQWVRNDPEEVDAALARLEAAKVRYNLLIKKAKDMGIKIDKITMFSLLLK